MAKSKIQRTYRVVMVRHQYGEISVQASSKKEAEDVAEDQLYSGHGGGEIFNEEIEIIEVLNA